MLDNTSIEITGLKDAADIHDTFLTRCRFCEIMLRGKDEFIGHMFHSHELNLDDLEGTLRGTGSK